MMQLDEFKYMERPPFIMPFVRVRRVELRTSSGLSNQKRYKKLVAVFSRVPFTRLKLLFDWFAELFTPPVFYAFCVY